MDPTEGLVRAALELKKPVITANKALLASPEGVLLRGVAKENGVDLLYEAAVAGAIPLVRALRESLTGERIQRVMGIVNGTTNFILTKMSEQGADYADVLAEAQDLGLAERDPTADVEGYDAAAKAAILAGVAFGYDVAGADVMREGITGIRAVDVEFAERLGYAVKLLAIVERTGDDALSVRVHPAMVPKSHPLAGVRDAFNAVFIEGEAAGELMLYGQGAGGLPTASAVVGDLIDAVRNQLAGTTAPTPERQPARLLPESDLLTQCYISLDVADRPGVLGTVATVFGDNSVSIRSMEQEGHAGEARLLFITHLAREGDIQSTLVSLAKLDAVERIGGVMRIVGDAK
jgi:homoserine dehydrogenase